MVHASPLLMVQMMTVHASSLQMVHASPLPSFPHDACPPVIHAPLLMLQQHASMMPTQSRGARVLLCPYELG